MWASAVLAAAIAAAYSLPILAPDELRALSEYYALTSWLVLAALATLSDSDRLGPAEKRFWRWIALAFGLWGAVEVGLSLGIESWHGGFGSFLTDLVYLLYYLSWLLALETRPHGDSGGSPGRWVGGLGRMLFACGLFAYFVLIPSWIRPDLYRATSPSFVFYCVLDLYLAARFTSQSLSSPDPKWRRLYALLGAAMLAVALTDLLTWLNVLRLVDLPMASLLDFAWFTPMFLVTVAARTSRRFHPAERHADDDPNRRDRERGVPLLVYSLALPAVHFSLEIVYPSSSDLSRPRVMLNLVWLVALGGLNFLQYIRLESWNRELLARRREQEERIRYLSRHDPLTGLLNRRELGGRLRESFSRSRRQNSVLALLFVDLDDFKGINDRFGHAVGDAVLCEAATRIKSCVRGFDAVIRFGGDEFVVILDSLVSPVEADLVARRLLSRLDHPVPVEGHTVRLSASLGVAVSAGGEPLDPMALVKAADQAMYQAKTDGGNQVSCARESRPAPGSKPEAEVSRGQ